MPNSLVASRKWMLLLVLVVAAIVVAYVFLYQIEKPSDLKTAVSGGLIVLPTPENSGTMSVEEAISKRRSVREYSEQPLTLRELSQILWAAQGITDPSRKLRAAPSAGATYPIEIYVVTGANGVAGLKPGVYRYLVDSHELQLLSEGDVRERLSKASLGQAWIAEAPVDLVITADYERTTRRYGDRGVRYVHMEAGHVAENIYLEATGLNLGTVTVGAFDDREIQRVLGLPTEHEPLYVMPIGHV